MTIAPFVLVDMINGAWGGRAHRDGVEGVTNPSQNMSNLPIETIEARYPVLHLPGGGYGAREAAAVANDLSKGYVSGEQK